VYVSNPLGFSELVSEKAVKKSAKRREGLRLA